MTQRGPHRLWTEAEDDWLRAAWEATDIAELARRLHRSVSALTGRIRKLGLRRKTLTLRAFARLHSVPISRVYWAMAQCALEPMHVQRTDGRQTRRYGAHCALTAEQQEKLRPLLQHRPARLLGLEGKKTPRGVWGIGIKPACCLECKSTERPHYSRGYCKPCSIRVWKWVDRRRKGRRTRGAPPESLMCKTPSTLT